MDMRLFSILGCLFVMAGASAFAQSDTLVLTLEETLNIARRQSPTVRIARSSFESSYWTFRSLDAAYYPQLSLTGSVPGLQREITQVEQPDGSVLFAKKSQLYSTVNLEVSQQISWTGGRLYARSGLRRIDLFDRQDTYFWSSTPLEVGLTQPLFSFNSMAWTRELEGMRYQLSQKRYAEAMEDAAAGVSEKFFTVYIAQMNVQNAQFNIAVNDTLYRLSKGRYEVGKIAENDLLQSELKLMEARTQLAGAQLDYELAERNLKVELGLPAHQPLRVVPPTGVPTADVDPDVALRKATLYRSDMIDYDVRLTEAERRVVEAEHSGNFGATINASVGFNQTGPNIPDVYRNPLDREQFNISFEIPLVQWGKTHAAVEAALAEQRAVRESIRLEQSSFEKDVYHQVMRFRQLGTQVVLSAKSDTIAQRRFEVAKNRYLIGKIDLNDLFVAQNEKDNARRNYIQTLRDYWVAYYRLRRLTLFDFENNTPLLPELEVER